MAGCRQPSADLPLGWMRRKGFLWVRVGRREHTALIGVQDLHRLRLVPQESQEAVPAVT